MNCTTPQEGGEIRPGAVVVCDFSCSSALRVSLSETSRRRTQTAIFTAGRAGEESFRKGDKPLSKGKGKEYPVDTLTSHFVLSVRCITQRSRIVGKTQSHTGCFCTG
jgi:hypothetical protein